MKSKFALAFLLVAFCAPVARAQFTTTAQHIIEGTSLPAQCSPIAGDVFILNVSGTSSPYYCQTANVWAVIAGGTTVGANFGALTGGTNLTAAMLVGSGSSLNFTGTGTINATSLGGNAASAFALLSSSNTFGGTQTFTNVSVSGTCTGCGVTNVASTFTGGIITVSGSPITNTGTLAFAVAGTSGGIPYFSSPTSWASSAALSLNAPILGGGAGAPTSGVRSGNTTTFVTSSGTLTSGSCAQFDSSGNLTATGSACGSGGGGNAITQLTGDINAGPGPGSVTSSINSGTVTLVKMAPLAANSIIGNNTAGLATPIALTGAQVSTLLGLGTASTQNTGTTGATLGLLNAALTFSGADIFSSTLSVQGNLTVNVTGITQCLHVSAAGVVSGTGADCGAAGGAITQLTGDVTTPTGGGSQPATIAVGAVTLVKMANLAANSIIGNNTASPATPIALTPSQVITLLGLGTAATQNTGTSGATLGLLNAALTFSGADTFSSTVAIQGNLTTNVTGASSQCLQASTTGLVSGTGTPCGSGGSGITQLTGDVLAGPGSGSVPATIATGVVTNAKLVNSSLTVNGSGCLGNAGAISLGSTGTVTSPNCFNITTANTVTGVVAPASPGAGLGAVWFDSTNLVFSSKNSSGTVSNTVVPSTAPSNQFATAISASGVISYAQPLFTNLSGSLACGQLPALTGDTTTTAGSCTTATTKIAGGTVPSNAAGVGTNATGQIVTSSLVSNPPFAVGGTTTCNFAIASGYTCNVQTMNGATTLAFQNMVTGQNYVLLLTQDGTGNRVPTYPATAIGFCIPWTEANVTTAITFYHDGTNQHMLACLPTNATETFVYGTERAAITSTTSGNGALTFDSASHTATYYANTSANRHAIPRVASSDQLQFTDIPGTLPVGQLPAGVTSTIASGATAMGTSTVNANSCDASPITATATGTATTDAFVYIPNANPVGLTGYGPGGLYVWAFPTANTVNFVRCNPTAANITPAALTMNWRVTR